MKILMLSPELAPYAKAGGLGDMVASLSKALAQAGHDVRIFLPRYGHLQPEKTWKLYPDPLAVHLDPRRTLFCRVWTAPFAGGAQVHFLEYDQYFGTGEVYGQLTDHGERFSFQTLAALDFCLQTGWIPDIVHAHDWTAGLAPVVLNTTRRHTPVGRAASVFTIHNLQHQGLVSRGVLPFLGLPEYLFTPNNLECLGGVNMMKGALYHATKLTTVSPTYAHEIQTPEYGFGLDPVLRHRWHDLTGIVNGIDLDEWNPAADKYLPAHYTSDDWAGKAACKAALQERLGLERQNYSPVFGVIARLYDQKGLDLLADILPDLLERAHLQVALLGSGDSDLENRFRALAHRFPGKCGVQIGYDNALAHLIEAGSDFFVRPSRFEPCGLNQLYSMRYGTLPIVRATGGLADTVEPWQNGPTRGTGILFSEAQSWELRNAIHQALQLYFDHSDALAELRRNAMARDFSWDRSAQAYEAVYREAQFLRQGAFPSR